MSDLDLDQLVHTADGRLVVEVLQGRRLPILIVVMDKGLMNFWYPPTVRENLETQIDAAMEWQRMLEEHIAQLRARCPKQ